MLVQAVWLLAFASLMLPEMQGLLSRVALCKGQVVVCFTVLVPHHGKQIQAP